MKLMEIFSSEELSSKEQVAAIAEVVVKARNAYGNGDAEITEPEINTIDGLQSLSMLDDESKVRVAQIEVSCIKTRAVEFCNDVEGAVLDKKIAELIALSPVLTSLTNTTESEYL